MKHSITLPHTSANVSLKANYPVGHVQDVFYTLKFSTAETETRFYLSPTDVKYLADFIQSSLREDGERV